MKTLSLSLITAIAIALCSCSPNSPNPTANSTLPLSPLPTPSPSPPPIPSTPATVSQFLRQSKFTCGEVSGAPTTMALTPRGNIPMIRWESQYFIRSGYDPHTRCQQVSGRFQQYHERDQLRYISTSQMNGYPILCVADRMLGSCLETSQGKAILFTLQPGDDAVTILEELLVVRDTASSPITQFAAYDSQGNMFVDIEKYISVSLEGNRQWGEDGNRE